MLAAFCLSGSGQQAPSQATLNAGKTAFDQGRYREAIKMFEKSLNQGCEVSFFLGLAHYRIGEPEDAIRNFQAAAVCDPRFAAAQVALAEAYAQRGDSGRALTAFLAALAAEPKNADALRGASRIYLDTQSNDKVIPVLETLLTIEPRDAEAQSHLGAAYAATSRLEAAEAQFRSALSIQPSNLSAMTGLANVLLKIGRREDAAVLLQKGAAASTKAYEPLYLLGSLYNSSGEPLKAAEALEKAVQLSPDQPEAWYQLARAYGRLERAKDRQRALESFKRAKDLGEKSRLIVKQTARAIEAAGLLVQQDDLRGAARVLELALNEDGGNTDLLFRTAGVHFDLKAYGRARTLVNQAIRMAPSEWQYEYLRGLIEKSDNRMADARKAMGVALSLNPKAAEVHNQMGDLELRAGNADAAVKHFKRAVELAPGDSYYRLNLEAAALAGSAP